MDTPQSHYARFLGLDDSWPVKSVDLQREDRRVETHLSHVGPGVFCPECGVACGLADHADDLRWRHLDTMQSRRSWSALTGLGFLYRSA